jgi:nuclear transport factor 2 (NTF2) superfamily protein
MKKILILTIIFAIFAGCDDKKNTASTVIDSPNKTDVAPQIVPPAPVVEIPAPVPTPEPEPEPAPPPEGIIINEMTDNIDAADVVKADLGTGFDPVASPTPEPEVVIIGDIYVDGKIGNDADDGTEKKPFKSIKRAQDYLKENGIKEGIKGATVCIAPGTYYLDGTLIFGKEDSGSDSKPNVYRGCQAEKPVIKGSKKISGFIESSKNIWMANLNGQIGADVNFYQVFKNDERLMRARHPNRDLNDIHGGKFLYVDKDTPDTSIEFKYKVADIDPSKWKNPEKNKIEVDIHPNFNWYKVITPIISVDSAKNTIKIAEKENDLRVMKEGNRYFVQNAFEFLDSDGEWYRDIETNTLYIYGSNGIADTDEITAPIINNLFYIEGANNLQFIGLQAGENDGTALDIWNSETILVQNCIVKNTKGHGIALRDGKNYQIDGNKIIEIGGRAVEAINSIKYRQELESADYLITGNEISHTNQYDTGSTNAVLLAGTVGAVVQYNKISWVPGGGIVFSGNNNIVEYNQLGNTALEVNDIGSIYIYTTDWLRRGNIVRYNYVLGSGGYANTNGEIKFPDYSWGIYLDGYSSGTHVYSNIVDSGAEGGILANGGLDNTIEDNLFIESTHTRQAGFNGYTTEDAGQKDNIKKACAGVLNLAANGYNEAKYFNNYPELNAAVTLCTDVDVNGLPKQKRITQGNRFINNRIIYPEANTPLYAFWLVNEPKMEIDKNKIWHGSKSVLVSHDGALRSWNWIKAKWGFDKNGVNISDNYKVQPFKITGDSGINLIKNSTFDNNITPWWSAFFPNPTLSWAATCGLGNGCLKVSSSKINAASAVANEFEIKKGNIYNLQFSIVADSHDELEVKVRENIAPWPDIGLQEIITVSKDPKKYDFTFMATKSFEKAWLTFQPYNDDPSSLYYLDNVVLKKVAATANDSKDDYNILINIMISRNKTFDLKGKDYCDLNGQPVSGSVTLKPMQSAILLSCYCNNDLFCNNKETPATCHGDCP